MHDRTALSSVLIQLFLLLRAIYIRRIDGNFRREITKHTVIYGLYIHTYVRFWPTLLIVHQPLIVNADIKKACEVAQRMLRKHREALALPLMSIMRVSDSHCGLSRKGS